jgi:hypothetical protein
MHCAVYACLGMQENAVSHVSLCVHQQCAVHTAAMVLANPGCNYIVGGGSDGVPSTSKVLLQQYLPFCVMGRV